MNAALLAKMTLTYPSESQLKLTAPSGTELAESGDELVPLWLGLCPNNWITGGKIISVKTREVKSRRAEALRPACHSSAVPGLMSNRSRSFFGTTVCPLLVTVLIMA
jgi:hypothetical protein